MTDQNDSFLREVEEEFRRERMARFFDRYGVMIIVALAVIALGFGGYQWYTAYQRDVSEKAGSQFAAAHRLMQSDDEADTKTAISDFERIAGQDAGAYSTLAKLKLAGDALANGKTDAAAAQFTAIAKDESVDPVLRTLADFQAASIEVATLDFTAAQNRLTPFTGQESTWRFVARERLGLVALREKNFDAAREIYSALLSEADAPARLRARAERMMALITAERVDLAKAQAQAQPHPGAQTEALDGANGAGDDAGPANGAQDNVDARDGVDTKKPDTSGTKPPADG